MTICNSKFAIVYKVDAWRIHRWCKKWSINRTITTVWPKRSTVTYKVFLIVWKSHSKHRVTLNLTCFDVMFVINAFQIGSSCILQILSAMEFSISMKKWLRVDDHSPFSTRVLYTASSLVDGRILIYRLKLTFMILYKNNIAVLMIFDTMYFVKCLQITRQGRT